MRRLAVALTAALAGGCLGTLDFVDPEVGAPLGERCANEDSDINHDVSFKADILPVLRAEAGPVGCACHQPTKPDPIGFEQTGLDLSSYSGLRAGGSHSQTNIVVPGRPCDSVLWQKVSAGPPFGARMPFNAPPFLADADRQRIADWIAEGARDN
ncbi:MAG: c-type cytochrome domain-containing protein [Myxococcota bacterium]